MAETPESKTPQGRRDRTFRRGLEGQAPPAALARPAEPPMRAAHGLATHGVSLQIVDAQHLGTDAELDALRAEHAHLVQQCEAAGLDATTHPKRRPVRALHPSAVIVPTILAACVSCLALQRELHAEKAARARTEEKYQIMHRRHTEMHKTQERYRQRIDALNSALGRTADVRK